MTYAKKLFIALDQLANAVFDGYPDETLSAKAERLSREGNTLPKKIINTIVFWQKDHCLSAYNNEMQRKQMPEEYRQ